MANRLMCEVVPIHGRIKATYRLQDDQNKTKKGWYKVGYPSIK
jgi:hypothetical protein